MKETSELFNEICVYKNWNPNDIDYEANLVLIRKKFRFLMNRIVFRKSDDYEYSTTHAIPIEDQEIVKALLIMAIKGKGEDKTCKKWFNGSLALNKYKERADLFFRLEAFLQSLLQKYEINEKTYLKWYAVLDTSLHGNTSKQILELYSQIDTLVEASVGMNNHVNLSAQLIKDDEGNLVHLFPPSYLEEDQIISEKKLSNIVKHDICQEDYFRSLTCITEYMALDAYEKTIKLIESYIPEIYHHRPINATMQKANLAFEGYGFFEQLYLFLVKYPEVLKDISDRYKIDADNILRYFKFVNRDKS